jgi:hypothetical protein
MDEEALDAVVGRIAASLRKELQKSMDSGTRPVSPARQDFIKPLSSSKSTSSPVMTPTTPTTGSSITQKADVGYIFDLEDVEIVSVACGTYKSWWGGNPTLFETAEKLGKSFEWILARLLNITKAAKIPSPESDSLLLGLIEYEHQRNRNSRLEESIIIFDQDSQTLQKRLCRLTSCSGCSGCSGCENRWDTSWNESHSKSPTPSPIQSDVQVNPDPSVVTDPVVNHVDYIVMGLDGSSVTIHLQDGAYEVMSLYQACKKYPMEVSANPIHVFGYF